MMSYSSSDIEAATTGTVIVGRSHTVRVVFAPEFKILWAVISTIPVDVVDMLCSREFPPKRGLHDDAMLENPSSPQEDFEITTLL
jgi:hypothetical protein